MGQLKPRQQRKVSREDGRSCRRNGMMSLELQLTPQLGVDLQDL